VTTGDAMGYPQRPMASDDLESLLTEFAERIRAVVKKEMLDAFLAGAGHLVPAPKRRGPGRPPGLSKGEKGDPEHGQRVAIIDTLSGNPKGLTFGELLKARPGNKARIRVAIRALVTEKLVKKAGVRRGTRYSIPKT
jgi:hypothetical protein